MEQKHVCDGCGGKIAYPSEYAGTKTNCPHCNAEITLGSFSPAKVVVTAKTGAASTLAIPKKIGIGAIGVVLIALAILALPSKKLSGVYEGPSLKIDLGNFEFSYRDLLDFREDGKVRVAVKYSNFSTAATVGKYSISGRTILVKFVTEGEFSQPMQMEFRMEGEDIVLVKGVFKPKDPGVGARWKRQ